MQSVEERAALEAMADAVVADVVIPGGLSVAKGTKLYIDPDTQILYTATAGGRLRQRRKA